MEGNGTHEWSEEKERHAITDRILNGPLSHTFTRECIWLDLLHVLVSVSMEGFFHSSN